MQVSRVLLSHTGTVRTAATSATTVAIPFLSSATRSLCTANHSASSTSPPPPPTPPPSASASSPSSAADPSASESANASTTNSGLGTDPYKRNPAFSALLSDPAKKALIDRMVRVDHAGELGARQIYAGQLAVFGGTPVGDVIHHMAEQERAHLAAFEHLVTERRVRPTAMLPLWNVAGYTLGLGTALLGKEAAMACTVAVEEVIAEHYNEQVRQLLDFDDEAQLRDLFRKFRDEELEHKDTGIAYDAERAPLYKALSNTIKAGCRAAIYVSERV